MRLPAAFLALAVLAFLAQGYVVVSESGDVAVRVGPDSVTVYSDGGDAMWSAAAVAASVDVYGRCVAVIDDEELSVFDAWGRTLWSVPHDVEQAYLVASDCNVAAVSNSRLVRVFVAGLVKDTYVFNSTITAVGVVEGRVYVGTADGSVYVDGGLLYRGEGSVATFLVRGPCVVPVHVVRSTGPLLAVYGSYGGVTVRAPHGLASIPLALDEDCRPIYPTGRVLKGVAFPASITALYTSGGLTFVGLVNGELYILEGERAVGRMYIGAPITSVHTSLDGRIVAVETTEGVRLLRLGRVKVSVSSPCPVEVRIGGVQLPRGEGNAYLEWGTHDVEAPPIVDVGNGTRCVLVAPPTSVRVLGDVDTEVSVTYRREYLVTVGPRELVGGDRWVPEGARVRLYAPPRYTFGNVTGTFYAWEIGGVTVRENPLELSVEAPITVAAVYNVSALPITFGNGTMLVPTSGWTLTRVFPPPLEPRYMRYYLVRVSEPGYIVGVGREGWFPEGARIRISIDAALVDGTYAISATDQRRVVFAGWSTGQKEPTADITVTGPTVVRPTLVRQYRVVLITPYGTVEEPALWVNEGTVISPAPEPTAVWSPIPPIRLVFAGWRTQDGLVVRDIAVGGPLTLRAVWTLDPIPIAAVLASAILVVAIYKYRHRMRLRRRAAEELV